MFQEATAEVEDRKGGLTGAFGYYREGFGGEVNREGFGLGTREDGDDVYAGVRLVEFATDVAIGGGGEVELAIEDAEELDGVRKIVGTNGSLEEFREFARREFVAVEGGGATGIHFGSKKDVATGSDKITDGSDIAFYDRGGPFRSAIGDDEAGGVEVTAVGLQEEKAVGAEAGGKYPGGDDEAVAVEEEGWFVEAVEGVVVVIDFAEGEAVGHGVPAGDEEGFLGVVEVTTQGIGGTFVDVSSFPAVLIGLQAEEQIATSGPQAESLVKAGLVFDARQLPQGIGGQEETTAEQVVLVRHEGHTGAVRRDGAAGKVIVGGAQGNVLGEFGGHAVQETKQPVIEDDVQGAVGSKLEAVDGTAAAGFVGVEEYGGAFFGAVRDPDRAAVGGVTCSEVGTAFVLAEVIDGGVSGARLYVFNQGEGAVLHHHELHAGFRRTSHRNDAGTEFRHRLLDAEGEAIETVVWAGVEVGDEGELGG